MRVLNLSPGFEPYEHTEGEILNFETFIFNGGEPHIKLDTTGIPEYIEDVEDDIVVITTRLTCSDDFMLLALAKDALNRLGVFNTFHLLISYFPAARQDRTMVPGEPLSVKVYTDFINSMEFNSVGVFDPHSDVTPALLDNSVVIDNHNFISSVFWDMEITQHEEPPMLVSPDAGSAKKITKLAKFLGGVEVVKCDKDRDTLTGHIRSFEVYAGDLKGRNCLIVDDICDGGGTFLGLADALRHKNCGKIYLAVSHGIFSKGFRDLNRKFDKIYTTDSFPNVDDPKFMMKYDKQTNKVIQIKLKDGLL